MYCNRTLFTIVILFLFCESCTTTKINKDTIYFQRGSQILEGYNYKEAQVKPYDLLGIQVFSASLNQEQALLFNMPNANVSSASSAEGGKVASSSGGSYQVNKEGFILMPLVGQMQVSGLTLQGLADKLTGLLSVYIKNPQVIPRFLEFKIQVLGEVRNPGPISINSTRPNIIDAIGLAGDLTYEGRRDSIVLIREDAGKRTINYLDLRSAEIFNSTVFQLQQNDVIYVQPNETKLKLLSVDPDQQRKEQRTLQYVGFGLGALSVVLNLIIILTR